MPQAEEPESTWINVLPWRKFLQILLVARGSASIHCIFTVLETIIFSTVLTCLEESEPNMFHCCTILIYLVHVTAAYDITLLFTCNVFSMILQ